MVAGRTQISLCHPLALHQRSDLLPQTMGGSQCYLARSPKAPSAQGPRAERPVQVQVQVLLPARASALATPARALVPAPSLLDLARWDHARGSHERAPGLAAFVVVQAIGASADSAVAWLMVPPRQGLATQRPGAGWRGPCNHRTTIGPSGEV